MQHTIKPKEQNSVAVKHAEIQLEEDTVLKQASSRLMNACQDINKLDELCYLWKAGFNMATVGCIHPCLPHHWRHLPMCTSLKYFNCTKNCMESFKQHGCSISWCQEGQ